MQADLTKDLHLKKFFNVGRRAKVLITLSMRLLKPGMD